MKLIKLIFLIVMDMMVINLFGYLSTYNLYIIPYFSLIYLFISVKNQEFSKAFIAIFVYSILSSLFISIQSLSNFLIIFSLLIIAQIINFSMFNSKTELLFLSLSLVLFKELIIYLLYFNYQSIFYFFTHRLSLSLIINLIFSLIIIYHRKKGDLI